MAYRSFIEEVPGNLKRTVHGTFDFRGRSTRTELFTFYVASELLAGLGLIPLSALLTDVDFDAKQEIRGVVNLFLMLPFPALFARRAHDQGRTGWWALLLLVAAVLAARSEHGGLHVIGIGKSETPFWLDSMLILSIIVFWAISLLPPTPETNRYGPNPRLDEADLTS